MGRVNERLLRSVLRQHNTHRLSCGDQGPRPNSASGGGDALDETKKGAKLISKKQVDREKNRSTGKMHMDELDLWVIQSLLQSKGCSSGTLYEWEKDKNLLLQLLLSVSQDFGATLFKGSASNKITSAMKTFMVDGGAPEIFVLTGLSKPVIWYSKRYVATYVNLRSLIMSPNGIDSGGIAYLFEILGSFFLSLGSESFAQTCFLQSLIEMPSYTRDLDLYESVNQAAHLFWFAGKPETAPEASTVALYFGFAHEIGHIFGDEAALKHPESLDHEQIRKALLRSGREIFDATHLYEFDRWAEELEQESVDRASLLNVENLRSERAEAMRA